jgi:hypothetical protein
LVAMVASLNIGLKSRGAIVPQLAVASVRIGGRGGREPDTDADPDARRLRWCSNGNGGAESRSCG